MFEKMDSQRATSKSDEPTDDDTRCDYFGWSPKWMQKFANIKFYIVVYGLVGFIEGSVGSYSVATLTTIEKRFKLPSRISGFIVSGWDVGLVCSVLFLAYMGSSGRKPRWVGCGTFLAGVLCIANTIPHIFYGAGRDAISMVVDGHNISRKDNQSEFCFEGSHESYLPSIILIITNIVLGMCSCTYYTLGFAYLDDNCSKNKAPFILALVFCIRLIGPTLGFSLGSGCLKLFIDPTLQPAITKEDPRWMGAWWLGWIPLGICNFILAIFMTPFPKKLPNTKKRPEVQETYSKENTIKDFKATLIRLFKNKVLMFNSLSSTLYVLGVIGYWAFMPKYFETQFQKSASSASLLTGSVGLICTGLGVLSSGAVISYFKPKPRRLAAWNVIVESLEVFGHISYAFFGCPTENLQGSWDSSGKWDMTQPCNADYMCNDDVKYNPMCSDDGSLTFFSPCHAGCISEAVNVSMVFRNCSCSLNGLVNKGVCPVDCGNNFLIFLVLLCTLRFFSATGRSGNAIIQFRSVLPEDKSVAIAVTEVMVALFGVVPGPMMYGYMIDTTCLAWEKVCGKPGNCWLYDGKRLRYGLNFTASALIALAVLADVAVWQNVKGMKIYEDDFKKPTEESTEKQHELIPFVERTH